MCYIAFNYVWIASQQITPTVALKLPLSIAYSNRLPHSAKDDVKLATRINVELDSN